MTKLTKEIVNERIYERGISLIGEFTYSRIKSLFKCSHDHEWFATPDSVMRSNGCPHCSNRFPLTKDKINDRLRKDEREIELVGDYVNIDTSTTFKCKNDHIWKNSTNNILNGGQNCPHCVGLFPLTVFEINKRLKDKNIELIGDYVNANTKTIFKCQLGHEWKTTSASVLHRTGCPSCSVRGGFNPLKHAHAYILLFNGFIKFGITNKLDKRLRVHRQMNGNYQIVVSKLFNIGQNALDWENMIKNTFGGNYVTKERCPDGYTETLSLNLLEDVKRTLL